ncbi:hypothetical protein [Halomicrococcus sp. NG-SE-24]|uniref:hypothetical protein n=1 Tax=Halomicrococcus sp. NG-SE-24 TaxID=3436928 RepID=UPI003D98A0F8
MKVLTTKDLYHSRDPDCWLLDNEKMRDAAGSKEMTEEELAENGFDPCPRCYPDRAEK